MNKLTSLVFILFTIVIMTTACSKNEIVATTDTIFIEGTEKIIGALVETFDKPYYKEDELQRFVDNELALYNSEVGNSSIIVNKFEVTNQAAKLYLQYNSYADYADFNKVEFFIGTVEDALALGYDFGEEFLNYAKLTSVSKEEVLEKKKNKVLISDEETLVQIDGSILFVSKNVEGKSKKSAQLTGESLSYIIYK